MQLQLEKFLFFFRVGPPSWALGFKRVGPPSTLKLASCQEIYFYFYLVSGIRWDITTAGPLNQALECPAGEIRLPKEMDLGSVINDCEN